MFFNFIQDTKIPGCTHIGHLVGKLSHYSCIEMWYYTEVTTYRQGSTNYVDPCRTLIAAAIQHKIRRVIKTIITIFMTYVRREHENRS